MDRKILVSVVLPVYNVEKYLEKAIQSVVNQTYDNLEIILVDDGSKDKSGDLCDLWEKKDERIIVIHKANGGLSSARNAALNIYKGDYVYFLDSDDYIRRNTIELMLQYALDHNAQIVEAPFIHVYNSRTHVRSKLETLKVMNTAEAIQYDLCADGGAVSACSKLYKHEIFEEYRFAEGRLNEDHLSIVDLLSKAKTIVMAPEPLYYYVHRKNSITTASFSKNSLDDIDAAKRNYEIVKRLYPEAIDAAEFRIDFSTLKVIDKIMLAESFDDKKLLDSLVEAVRENRKRILKCKYISKKRKLSFLILLTNKKLYRWFVRENAKKSWSD